MTGSNADKALDETPEASSPTPSPPKGSAFGGGGGAGGTGGTGLSAIQRRGSRRLSFLGSSTAKLLSAFSPSSTAVVPIASDTTTVAVDLSAQSKDGSPTGSPPAARTKLPQQPSSENVLVPPTPAAGAATPRMVVRGSVSGAGGSERHLVDPNADNKPAQPKPFSFLKRGKSFKETHKAIIDVCDIDGATRQINQ